MTKNDDSTKKILSEISYKMGKKLGEGMFSAVKLANHSLTNEQVAIKILEKTKITKIEDKERINREISIMKKVNHFNIAKLYAVVETKLNIYLIQEHIQGKEFLEYLNKKGKLKEAEACKFFHQIISGLDYLHQCGIAHRDFKPENILLINDNQILKIIDFGLSHTYKTGELLKTGCGSPCYVPPEMVKEEQYNGALSDIWSAGIILYLMLCGNLPFYDDDNQILYEKILSGKYEVPNHLSENAKDILSKILEIEPKKRINFEGIKSHPWFNIIDKNYLIHKGINIDTDIKPIDEEILDKMEKMGLNKVEIRYNIIKNYHNKITTIYDLLLKKKIENGVKSVSDLSSDVYDEYINDKKNKIQFYGNMENVLKNRIGDNQQIVNDFPNWPENKYDDNNENMVIGDSGSVIERLIKAGKFTYDEENMCINRVVSSKISKLKKSNNIDEDSKFKTISSIQEDKAEKIKFKKTTDFENKNRSPEVKMKKNKVHFKDETNEENNIISQIVYESPKKKSILHKSTNKAAKKEKNEEDEDWYKEMEALIDTENRRKSETIETPVKNKKKEIKFDNKIKGKEIIKKYKTNNEKDFDSEDSDDSDNLDSDRDNGKKKSKLCLSTEPSQTQLKKSINKKAVSKFGNNASNNMYKSTKDIKKVNKKCDNYHTSNNKKSSKTAKTKKTIKIIRNIDESKYQTEKIVKKREKSDDKKISKRSSKLPKNNGKNEELNKDDGINRRNQSATKRKLKINI